VTTKQLRVSAAVIFCAASVFAVPTLQLDADPGSFNKTDDTTFATATHFDLIALLNGTLDTSRNYYISIALEPKLSQATPPPNGSFKLNDTVFSIANMGWGTPPAGASKTLSPHDEFPTYFSEFAFNFDSLHTVAAYDVQDGKPASGTLYSHTISVDTSPLLAGYSLHFDLYNIKTNSDGQIEIDEVAPFSHDAQSLTQTTNPPPPQVPDNGATWMLMGVALCGLALMPKMRPARVRAGR